MIKVALTGGIASGKSEILTHLMMSGYVIYSTDSLAHDVLKHEGKQKVIDTFGTGIVDAKGEINRSTLGKIVFNDNDKLNKLNDIIHPFVKIRIEDQVWLRQYTSPPLGGTSVVFLLRFHRFV